jgi:hypothetical protein
LHLSNDERVHRAQVGAGPGAILLAHDGFAGPDDGVDDGPEPVFDRGDLVRALLESYAAAGLVGRSLGDALAIGTEVREARFPA